MDLSTLQPFLDWLALHPNLAGFIIFAVAAAESLAVVGILVPGVVFMLGIGALIGLDAIPLWSSLVWAALGAVVGDGVSYWLGRHFDQQLRHVWPLSNHPDLIPKGERFFLRHGAISILFGRFVGPVRPIIPAVAGIMHMPVARFYLVNILSAIAWAPVVLLPGVAMGASLHQAADVALRFGIAAMALLLLFWFAGWLLYRIVKLLFARQLDWLTDTLTHLTAHPYAATVGLVTLVVLFAGGGWWTLHEPAAAKPRVFNQAAWWEGGWEKFAARHTDVQTLVGLQWLGNLQEIQGQLRGQGWYNIQPLSIKNAALWAAPAPDLSSLPLPVMRRVAGSRVALMGFATDPGRQWVLELWSAKRVTDLQATPLWFGSIRAIELIEGPFSTGIPRASVLAEAEVKAIVKQFYTGNIAVKHVPAGGGEVVQWLLLLK